MNAAGERSSTVAPMVKLLKVVKKLEAVLALMTVPVALTVLFGGCSMFPGGDWEPPPRSGGVMQPGPQAGVWGEPASTMLAPPKEAPAELSGDVMVVIDRIEGRAGQRDLAALAWELSAGDVVAAGGGLAGRNGILVGVGGEDFAVRFQAASSQYRASDMTRQFITTQSDTEGVFFVGEELPVERLVVLTPRGSVVLFERTTVGRSLVVRPVILPDRSIELEVIPVIRSLARGGRSVRLEELATQVVVRHGQPMVLGGLHQVSNSVGGVLFGSHSGQTHRTLTIILTPYLL